jgi:hypothetical protein
MPTDRAKTLRRGLVVQGGGAKGAFALGCMRALRDHGIEFSAVAGTSAGALCAIIWSTGRIDEGAELWKKIDHSGFFGRQPEGCGRRLLKVLCVVGKLFASYLKNVEPESRSNFGLEIFFSVLVGIFSWLLLFGLLPLRWWLVAVTCVPIIGLFALTNELPLVGWDNRVRQFIVDVFVFVATTRLMVSFTWLVLTKLGIVTIETNITLVEVVSTAAVLAMIRLPY